MIQQIKSRRCKQTYIEDLELEKMTHSELNEIVIIDTKERIGNSCKLLFVDYHRGRHRLYSAYTQRHRTIFKPKRYLVVDYNVISDIQEECLGKQVTNYHGVIIKHVRWSMLLPGTYLDSFYVPNKDLHDF